MLKKIYLFLFLIVSSFVLFSCDIASVFDLEDSFLLTEVSTSGSIGGLSVDYIELQNQTDEDITLTGYYFGDSEDVDDCYEISMTFDVNEWDDSNSEWVSTKSSSEAPVIPANGYLIILFSNDFAIDEVVSFTELETWYDDGEEQTVDDEFSNITYLTVPAGLKDSKAEGVYIFDEDKTQVANTFTYEADEQGEDTVFLYINSSWTQGVASPGALNEEFS